MLNYEKKTCVDFCEKHNINLFQMFRDGAPIHDPYCPDCADEKVALRREEEKRQHLARRLADLDIGKRFRGRTFDEYQVQTKEQTKVKAGCQRYAETFAERRKAGDCLLLMGRPGTGKNHLVAAIAERVTTDGFLVLHTSAIKLVRSIKETWDKHNRTTEAEAVERFLAPDLLIIDEIGAQFGSQTEQVFLMEVINGRYADMLPTILLTNLDAASLSTCLGEQIVDRFYEGKSQVLYLPWDSYRRK